MAVLLALCSAVAYGVSDFVGGLVSRRTSAWSVAVVGQASSATCVAIAALFIPGDATRADLLWGVLAGVGSGTGAGFLYRGFSSGRMGVVAPVSAVGAAIVPVLTGTTAGGEHPSLLVWVGIVAAFPGIWLVSRAPDDPLAPGPRSGSVAAGALDGALAGIGFGMLFAALGQVPDGAGWWPLTACQAVSVPSVVLLAMALKAEWRPRGPSVRLAVLCGPLSALATGMFLLATQSGFLAVAGVLTSLYPASTVLLAALVLREKVHRAQGLGLALCAVAIAFVAGG